MDLKRRAIGIFSGISLLKFACAFLLAAFALALNTTGFDFYVHALSVMSWDDIPKKNGVWNLPAELQVPRYLLGHHILYLLTFGVFPLAWIVITIHAALFVACLRRLEELAWYLTPFLGIFFAYNFIFMSMNGVGAAFLLLAVLSRWNGRLWWPWLFLGAAFHPVALVLGVVLAFMFLPWAKSFLAVLGVVLLSHVLAISFPESGIGVRTPFKGLSLQANLMGALFARIVLFFKIFGLGFVTYGVIRFARPRLRLRRFPIPGALSVAAVLIAGAAMAGWEAQFQSGSAISYIWETDYSGVVQSDKNQLICAAWISRTCYHGLGEERGFGFRQETVR